MVFECNSTGTCKFTLLYYSLLLVIVVGINIMCHLYINIYIYLFIYNKI